MASTRFNSSSCAASVTKKMRDGSRQRLPMSPSFKKICGASLKYEPYSRMAERQRVSLRVARQRRSQVAIDRETACLEDHDCADDEDGNGQQREHHLRRHQPAPAARHLPLAFGLYNGVAD